MSKVNLLNDLALNESSNKRVDGLDFLTYAEVLGNAIVETPGPFTVGVFGEWGTGKTSLMRLMQSHLEDNTDVLTVWFNAWRYEKEEHPIVPLLATIIREVQEDGKFFHKLGNIGKEFINSLRAIAYGFSVKSTLKVPGIAEVEASFVAKEMMDKSNSLAIDPLLSRSLYYESFERLNKIHIPKRSKIVIFVDDLDRCFPDMAIKLLESIKLVLAQEGFVFVLGVARSVIEGYLKFRYQKEYGIESFQGEQYLDKIVQLSFHIPPSSNKVGSFCESILSQLNDEDREIFRDVIPEIATTTGNNPRAIIRFVNNLFIDRAVNEQLAKKGKMEEIPIGYFAISRILQQQWPSVFRILFNSSSLSKDVATWNPEDVLTQSTSRDTNVSQLAAVMLTDKNLTNLLLSEYGIAWLSDENKRSSAVGFLRSRTFENEKTRTNNRKFDLFISYSNTDRETVSLLVNYLVHAGFSVFYDAFSLTPGVDIRQMIESALQDSRAVLFCIGPEISNSRGLQMELGIASTLYKNDPDSLYLIPVIPPGATFNMMPFDLKEFMGIDLSGGVTDENVKLVISKLLHLRNDHANI